MRQLATYIWSCFYLVKNWCCANLYSPLPQLGAVIAAGQGDAPAYGQRNNPVFSWRLCVVRARLSCILSIIICCFGGVPKLVHSTVRYLCLESHLSDICWGRILDGVVGVWFPRRCPWSALAVDNIALVRFCLFFVSFLIRSCHEIQGTCKKKYIYLWISAFLPRKMHEAFARRVYFVDIRQILMTRIIYTVCGW